MRSKSGKTELNLSVRYEALKEMQAKRIESNIVMTERALTPIEIKMKYKRWKRK
ncbi:hypothetical protein [Paenibacillus pinihumi]|uniref:hypothetical protein n=1 Tax=Paenibacillus pinihumi TaxID=669462 RepID=UPI0004013485|nr:hypothetical protein [Paenibacillus pinihumi]